MRRLPIGLIAVIAGSALARPATGPTWADWVGDWNGKLRWTSCTLDGEAEATLPIDANDGTMAIDLAPAGAGLEGMHLAADRGGWVGQEGDITVHVTRTRPDTAAVAVDLASGCQVRAELHRPTVGIAACDRLAAWARIEEGCTRLVRPPLEDPARLVRQRASWEQASDGDRGELAAQCDARASRVEAELVAAGCAPNPDPTIGLHGAECLAMTEAAARVDRCPAVPPDERSHLARDAEQLEATARAADPAHLPVVEHECRQLRDRLATAVRDYHCAP